MIREGLAFVALGLVGAGVTARVETQPSSVGPPPGFTGGFGEPTCQACHSELELNAPGGRVEVAGLPRTFTPGEVYVLSIRLESEGMAAAGFQTAVRFADGPLAAGAAGRLAPIDARVQVQVDTVTKVPYASHTFEGSRVEGTPAEWTLEWFAPRRATPVRFDVSANSGNGDNSPLGDLIYTTSVEVVPAASR